MKEGADSKWCLDVQESTYEVLSICLKKKNPNVAFEIVLMLSDCQSYYLLLSRQMVNRWIFLLTSVLRPVGGVMPLALRPQIVSEALLYIRYSKMEEAICHDLFVRHFILSVGSFPW